MFTFRDSAQGANVEIPSSLLFIAYPLVAHIALMVTQVHIFSPCREILHVWECQLQSGLQSSATVTATGTCACLPVSPASRPPARLDAPHPVSLVDVEAGPSNLASTPPGTRTRRWTVYPDCELR